MNIKMTSQIRALGVYVAVGLGVLSLGVMQPATADAAAHGSLTGTWRVQVQQYECATDIPIGLPFASFLTFGSDRTLVETTANPTFEPGQRSAGHGFWNRTGRDDFRAVSEAFIIFASPARGPIPAFSAGRQRIEQNIEYAGGDTFKADAIVEFTDPSGTVLRSGCARASAARME